MDDDERPMTLGGKKPAEAGEVDYKTKAGTAWSHSYLNQKPWHPLSYPNQRRKWIAEQTHAQRQRRSEEIAREFAQEQEFFRQTALFSKKEKEKMETMKAVSFMYVRPPGYNSESAKAAEIADEQRRLDQDGAVSDPTNAASSSLPGAVSNKNQPAGEKKSRPKDVFGRALPTEEEFEVLKNAPRLETGAPARVKPFGIEIRNVRCVRCGKYGHQSGDRECPLRDAMMPNEESRLKREDPLTAIVAQTDSNEPLKWELKQRPGISPPRGGFRPDDPNQQIVADDIFDEYGGFLSGGRIPALLSNFSACGSKNHSKHRSKSKHKHRHSKQSSSSDSEIDKEKKKISKVKYSSYSDSESKEKKRRSKAKHNKKKKGHHSDSRESEKLDSSRRHHQRKHDHRHRHSDSSKSEDSDSSRRQCRRKHRGHHHSGSTLETR